MADVSVNSVKASEVSNEMVALYLLASVASNDREMTVNIVNGVPVILGADKKWLIKNYVDCLRSILRREAVIS